MHKIFKYIICFIFVLCVVTPFSISAEQVDEFPSDITQVQQDWLYQYLYNYQAYPDLLVLFNPSYPNSVYVSLNVSDFDFEAGSFYMSDIMYMNKQGYVGSATGSRISNFRTNSRQFFFMKVDGVFYFGSTFLAPFTNNFLARVTQSVSDIEFTYDYETTYTDLKFELPPITADFSGTLTCLNQSNGVCSVFGTDVSGNNAISSPFQFETDEVVIDMSSYSTSSSTLSAYSYIVETKYELLFDDYYTGYFEGDFSGYTSDNAIIIGDRLYFTDALKINLTSKETFTRKSSVTIPIYSFKIFKYSFQKSLGRPIYDPSGNQLIESGNNTSQSASSSLNSVTNQFDSTASQYDAFESQFNNNLTDSLSDIDISSVNLGSISDFTRTASFIKTQFDDILTSSGLFQTAISFVLILGVALLLLGRRL